MLHQTGNGPHIAKCQAGPFGGTGWKGHSVSLLGELSGCPGPLCAGSLQPRVQGRVAVACRADGEN